MRKKAFVAVAVAAAAGIALLAAAALGAFARGSHQSAAGARIGVHGAWKIVVKNPDGRVVAVRRFHNDLIGTGVPRTVLGGFTTPGWWEVGLTNNSGATNSPCVVSGNGAPCTLVPTGHDTGISLFNGHRFDGMTTTSVSGALELKGQAFADRSGSIDRVSTALFQCPPSIAHSACDQSNWQVGNTFTGTNITALSVVAGQQILVTVDISFETA